MTSNLECIAVQNTTITHDIYVTVEWIENILELTESKKAVKNYRLMEVKWTITQQQKA